MNRYLLKSAIVAALGGLLFGFDTAVIAGATRALSEVFQLTPAMLGFTVSTALWGTVLGSIVAGTPSDRYGRRAALQALAVLYVLSAIGCAFAWDWYSFVFARFLGGLAIGGSSVIGPMYIAEIAPAARRGRLVGMFQFNIVAGILVAYFSNYVIGTLGFGATEWRWKLGISAIPALLFFAALKGIPQSPRWLVRRGRIDEACEVLARIGERDPRGEVRDIAESVRGESASASEPLFVAKYRFPIFLAVMIGIFNQFSGVNAILYYSNDIFEKAGFSKVSSDLQTVAIGLSNLLFTMIAMSMIDRLGRKKLLLIGAAGTACCLTGVAAVFATGVMRPLGYGVSARVADRRAADRAVRDPRVQRIVDPLALPAAHDFELVLDPGLFWQLKHEVPQVGPWHWAQGHPLGQAEDPVDEVDLVGVAAEQKRAPGPFDDRYFVPGKETVDHGRLERPALG